MSKGTDYAAAKEVAITGINDFPTFGQLWMYLAICNYGLHNQQEAPAAAYKARTLLPDPIQHMFIIKF